LVRSADRDQATGGLVELDGSRLFNQDKSELLGKIRADSREPYLSLIQRIVGIR